MLLLLFLLLLIVKRLPTLVLLLGHVERFVLVRLRGGLGYIEGFITSTLYYSPSVHEVLYLGLLERKSLNIVLERVEGIAHP